MYFTPGNEFLSQIRDLHLLELHVYCRGKADLHLNVVKQINFTFQGIKKGNRTGGSDGPGLNCLRIATALFLYPSNSVI